MRRAASAAAVALALLATPAAAQDCAAPGPGWARLESSGAVAWLATRPERIDVGGEFAVEARLCMKGGAAPRAVRLDAWMPAHRHGMNLRPSVKPLGEGRWRAEGFSFHMPGRWQFTLEVDTAVGRERLSHDVELQ